MLVKRLERVEYMFPGMGPMLVDSEALAANFLFWIRTLTNLHTVCFFLTLISELIISYNFPDIYEPYKYSFYNAWSYLDLINNVTMIISLYYLIIFAWYTASLPELYRYNFKTKTVLIVVTALLSRI